MAFERAFASDGGPDWGGYVALLRRQDELWIAEQRARGYLINVLGDRPSWADTLKRSRYLFDRHTWSHLDEDDQSLIAPTHDIKHGDALFGSVGRRVPTVVAFLTADHCASDRNRVHRVLQSVRNGPPSAVTPHAGDMVAELCEIDGIAKAFATRLLALARPDVFFVVNNRSRPWLRAVTGLKLAGKRRAYQALIDWLTHQRWHFARPPADLDQRFMWDARAALLDCFAYYAATRQAHSSM